MFDPGFEAAEHLGPAHAVAVGAFEALLRFAPSAFGDANESVGGVEGLEGYLDGGFVVDGRVGAVRAWV